SGRTLLALPTTHSLGDLARALARPWSLPAYVHVYFHDTDLLDARRRAALPWLLRLLARVAAPADPAALLADAGRLPERAWADVARA
ncbi:MAG TPA: hypothetical protein VNJ53_01400, partial [Gaiellaceae bacterium]|nr:hypothetical protein [Gaiellaceae bacterium]